MPLLFDVTAVAFVISGQSFMLCGNAVSAELSVVAFKRRAVTGAFAFLGFVFCAFGRVQQSCWRDLLQLSSETAAVVLSGETSAASTSLLLQPNRQPPAIHTDTLTAKSSRVALLTSVKSIGGSLLPFPRIVEKTGPSPKTQKHKNTASFM